MSSSLPMSANSDGEEGGSLKSSDRSFSSSSQQRPRRSLYSKKPRKRKSKRDLASNIVEDESLLRQQMASLQLPNMPSGNSLDPSKNPPTLRILVVADVDLKSASALAESALIGPDSEEKTESSNGIAPANVLDQVDLCIACGPFCRDEDLAMYYQGRQRTRLLSRRKQRNAAGSTGGHSSFTFGQNTSFRQGQGYQRDSRNAHGSHYGSGYEGDSPESNRSREETAAFEGLMTAALSQLESIVCRVVYVPGDCDPISTISPLQTANSTNQSAASSSRFGNGDAQDIRYKRERRLTPNSRNLHQHWMPLCPGLGCSGLLYLDHSRLRADTPAFDDNDADDDDEDEDADDSSSSCTSLLAGQEEPQMNRSSSVAVSPMTPADIAYNASHYAKQYGAEFCRTLEKLVELAPPLAALSDPSDPYQISNVLATSLFQTILVSNFYHLEKAEQPDMNGGISFPSQDREKVGGEHEPSIDAEYDEEESFDPPWPVEHEAFCALPSIQDHVLLEIASGMTSSGTYAKPMELPKGKLRVVLPGSLRERGEYCLIDVAFMKDPYQKLNSDYRWRVRRTRFHTLNDYHRKV